MSAYVVDNVTINRILTFISRTNQDSELRRPLEALGYSLNDPCCLERLGEDMLALNIFSVRERYGYADDWVDMVPDEPFRFECVTDANKNQPYKSLRCFMYQSCEGSADAEPLFRALHKVNELMDEKYSARSEAYERAAWG